MEFSYEEAQKMIRARIDAQPAVAKLVADVSFKKTLTDILAYEGVDAELFPIIENEVLVILAQYSVLGELAKNIAESTHLPLEKAEGIAVLVDTLLLGDIHDILVAFEHHWYTEIAKVELVPEANKEMKEKLELRPDGVPQKQNVAQPESVGARPLTREEVLRSIAPSRTMAKDIATLTEKKDMPSIPTETGKGSEGIK